MGLAHKPVFRIQANGKDITAAIKARLTSLTITDEAGFKSDSITIKIENTGDGVRLPSQGAELRVWLGYGSPSTYMGLFVVNELELSGPPDSMTIRANGAAFKKSNSFSALQTRKERSWTPTTVGEMVDKIASEHGLSPAISEELKGHALSHIDQVGESDLNMLTRIARDVEAITKVGNGKLIFAKESKGKTTSGKTMPVVNLRKEEISTYSVKIAERAAYKSVVAKWRDTDNAKDVQEKAGSGEPAFIIRHVHKDQKSALDAARSRLNQYQRGKAALSLTLPGRSDLRAESKLHLSGLPDGVNGVWTVKRVTHELGAGYRCRVEGEG
ncbi:MAG: contractile injection system protein, VgrG/Pvc8 family [Desulfovibrio sp.]